MRVLACASAALLGAGLILAELAYTRLFGYLYSSDRVFVLAGLGALGLPAGAFLSHRLGWHPRRRPTILAFSAALAGTCALLAAVGAASGRTVFLASLLIGLPELLAAYAAFATVGLALAALAGLTPGAAGGVAAALFAGAAGGAALFPALAGTLRPPTTALLAAALLALGSLPAASAALRVRRRNDETDDLDDGAAPRAITWIATAVFAATPLVGLGAQLAIGWLTANPATIIAPKPIFQSVGVEENGERVVFSAWDGHSRTDVTEHPLEPRFGLVYQDGAVSGRVIHGGAATSDVLRQHISYLPYLLPGGKDQVLVVGAGGGEEVAAALDGGAREVVVADSNPVLASVALDQLAAGVFSRQQVRFVGEDARTFLRGTGETFDLIVLTPAASGAPQPGGASAGSGLLTMEAYATYMNALKPDGRLVVQLRDEEELLRAFTTAYHTWLQLGSGEVEAARRISVFVPPPPQGQSGGAQIILPLLTVRRTPYQQQEIAEVARVVDPTPFLPLFLPHAEQQSAEVYPWFVGVLQVGPDVIGATRGMDIRPANDARPFFYEASGAVPIFPLAALLVFSGLTGAVAWLCRRPEGESVVIADEVDARAAAFLDQRVPWRYLGFGALAGAAWGFLTLPLLHRVPHLVGQPLLTGPVVYGALLGGAALGAAIAAPVRMEGLRPVIGWAGLAGGVLAVAILELLPLISGSIGGLPLAARAALLGALLAPIGFSMGIPLPGAARLLSGAHREGWIALFVAVALFGATAARYLAYVTGVAWTLSIPTVLGGLCLFGIFLMAGLRALVFAADDVPVDAPAARPAEDHTAWKKPTL